MALGLLTNETYTLNNAQFQQPLAQYVRTIMRHDIRSNIINIANKLSFIDQDLAPEHRVFVLPLTKSTKTADFIRAFKEK